MKLFNRILEFVLITPIIYLAYYSHKTLGESRDILKQALKTTAENVTTLVDILEYECKKEISKIVTKEECEELPVLKKKAEDINKEIKTL